MNNSTTVSFTTLKGQLLLGFCGVLMAAGRAGLRLKLGISGHAMLVVTFCLLIGRGCVRRFGAAIYTGILAGCIIAALGIHRSGVLIIPQLAFTGLVVDLAAMAMPSMFTRPWQCAVAGGLAGATRLVVLLGTDMLAGMDMTAAVAHSALGGVGNILFGAIGGLAVPMVLRKLAAFGAIPPFEE